MTTKLTAEEIPMKKYDDEFLELCKQSPQIAEITVDRALAELAYIGKDSESESFSHLIHRLANLRVIVPATVTTAEYQTSASLRITPGYRRLQIEMTITADMLIQIAAMDEIDSITPPLLCVMC